MTTQTVERPTIDLSREQMQTLASGSTVTTRVPEDMLTGLSRIRITTVGSDSRSGSTVTVRLSEHALSALLYYGQYTVRINGERVVLDGVPLPSDGTPPLIVDAEWVGPDDGMRRSFPPVGRRLDP